MIRVRPAHRAGRIHWKEQNVFKNLMLYRVGPEWPTSAAQWEEALTREPFAECGATQQKSTGWVPPRGEAHGALVEVVDGQWIARFAIETKAVPGEAVRRRTQEAIAAIEKTTGRKPGKKEVRDLRDDALIALLPQAFARQSQQIDAERVAQIDVAGRPADDFREGANGQLH